MIPELLEPLKIKDKIIKTRLLLAPMAGLGTIAFRELISKYPGYGLLFSEMCNAKAVPHENRFVSPFFKWRNEELNSLVCQLLGNNPEAMANAAIRIEREGFFGVDINMGCSTGLICKKGYGAAIMRDSNLAFEIVNAMRKVIKIPLFVKFRIGWEDSVSFVTDFAKRLEQAGADALVFHPRIAPDRRGRPPKWDYITHVKNAVSIPVFGNGNVLDEADCKTMLATGCDGISLGRIAVVRPWIFSVLTSDFTPLESIYLDTLNSMIFLLGKHYSHTEVLKRFTKFAIYFFSNFKFGHSFCSQLSKIQDLENLKIWINQTFNKHLELEKTPNMLLFGH